MNKIQLFLSKIRLFPSNASLVRLFVPRTPKTRLYCLLLCLVAAPAIHAQTVDEIVDKYVAALGGKDKLKSIRSVYQEGVAVMQNGTEIDSKLWKVQGKLFRNEYPSAWAMWS